MREPLSLATLIVFFCIFAMVLLLITGCTDARKDCVERQQQIYLDKQPKASYAELQSKQHDFQDFCSRQP